MQNKIGSLAGIALIQMGLVAWFWFGSDARDAQTTRLFAVDVQAVDRLSISSSETEVEVVRTDQGWQVGGAPADAEKVSALLDKLVALEAPWPAGTSAEIAQRFEVTESNFQRRVTLSAAGTTVAEAYFGTSPGYQRVHARMAQSDQVYAVKLSNYELGLNIDAWLDKAVMATEQPITRVQLNQQEVPLPALTSASSRVLEQDLDDTGNVLWTFAGEPADVTKAETYVNRFGNLRVLGLADPELVASAGLLASIDLTTETGSVRYEVLGVPGEGPQSETDQTQNNQSEASQEQAGESMSGQAQSGSENGPEIDQYLIKQDGVEQVYRLASYVAEQLLMQDTDFKTL